MADKIYFNSITIKEGKYGLRVSINYNKFIAEAQNHLNDKGYINLDFNERKEVGKYGETHYASLNEWTPKEKADKTVPPIKETNEDVPF